MGSGFAASRPIAITESGDMLPPRLVNSLATDFGPSAFGAGLAAGVASDLAFGWRCSRPRRCKQEFARFQSGWLEGRGVGAIVYLDCDGTTAAGSPSSPKRFRWTVLKARRDFAQFNIWRIELHSSIKTVKRLLIGLWPELVAFW